MHGGTILLLVLMGITVIVLLAGIFIMARGGETNRKYGNKMMVLRVACQAAALAVFAILLVTRH